ncbi:DUF4326 domain-containing protein [Glycomyces tarimensis]
MPKRIQRKRVKGWRMPAGAIYVGRGSKWGNPFRVYRCDCCGHWDVVDDNGVQHHIDHAVARGEASPMGIVLDPTSTPSSEGQRREAVSHAVELFQQDIEWGSAAFTADQARAELAGRDLMCWCPLDQACHADVLLELANGGGPQ